MEDTMTNLAARFIFKDEEEVYVFVTSDFEEIKKKLPMQYKTSGFLKAGENISISGIDYVVTNIIVDYYNEMVIAPESFRDHEGNYNLWNLEIFVAVKRL